MSDDNQSRHLYQIPLPPSNSTVWQKPMPPGGMIRSTPVHIRYDRNIRTAACTVIILSTIYQCEEGGATEQCPPGTSLRGGSPALSPRVQREGNRRGERGVLVVFNTLYFFSSILIPSLSIFVSTATLRPSFVMDFSRSFLLRSVITAMVGPTEDMPTKLKPASRI